MINREFAPQSRYTIAIYARMSDRKQNKRSPDQQIETVKETIRRLKVPWKVIKVYRDDGIKARYFRRRKGLQALLRDIEAGLIQIDLIAVDTWERFGRHEEFEDIRRKLLNAHGVMIVTADTNFANPTGVIGKAVGMIESVRSSEEGRVKCHNVLRGKRDALRLKHWPGGPTPFGFRLDKRVDNSGPEPRMYSVLQPDPETVWIRQRLLHMAAETGWGSMRLAKWLNKDPEIPEAYKPFYSPTIDYWLDDEINIGIYVWGEHNTDIINDTRVIEPAANPDDIQRIEDFCEAIIDKATFETIQATRNARKRASSGRGKAGSDGKLIKPTGRGQSVVHPLSGLVICECGGFMNAVTSGRKSKAGTTYTYRACPRRNDGACENHHHVREDDLWKVVIARLRARLFPTKGNEFPEWFPSLMAAVQRECDRLYEIQPDRLKGIRERMRAIDDKIEGWKLTLASAHISGAVRDDILGDYEAAVQERDQLANELARELALGGHVKKVFDGQTVMDRLHKLDEILAGDNATLMNVALSMHIERIQCFGDGRVVMRGTNLGLFEGGVELLSDASHTPSESMELPEMDGAKLVTPRRRARRHVPNLISDDGFSADAIERCSDVHRFDQLPDEFKWEETFYIRPKMSWSEEHAEQIYQEWLEVQNIAELARLHSKSTPTIRKAMEIARKRRESDNGTNPDCS